MNERNSPRVLECGCPSSPRREHRGHGQVSVAPMKPGSGVHLPLWPVSWAVYRGHNNHLWHQPVIHRMSAVSQRDKRCGWWAGRAAPAHHGQWAKGPPVCRDGSPEFWFWDWFWLLVLLLGFQTLGTWRDTWHWLFRDRSLALMTYVVTLGRAQVLRLWVSVTKDKGR